MYRNTAYLTSSHIEQHLNHVCGLQVGLFHEGRVRRGGDTDASPLSCFHVCRSQTLSACFTSSRDTQQSGALTRARSPTVLEAQSPLKLDSLFHHASGNNLIKGRLRAKEAHHPILDDPQSTNMKSK